MQTLDSYVAGKWQTGTGQPTVLSNPTTGAALAEVSSEGIDFQAVLDHARGVGGPALRALTFVERGGLLKDLSAVIHEHREELIGIGTANGGNTRGDAKFDIDGATGTLAAYARIANGLGDRPFLVDGDPIQLGRTARFSGQHVWMTRPGVAVHINAFNFPAWGMLEKAACALLAGVPVIEKPGTSTAMLAWRIARIIVASGILPEGAFQFIAGSVGDLLTRLEPLDCVAFTGSARTGALIRGIPNLVERNVRVNIEADSLNSAVLAPDVDAESDTYGIFLKYVALDMTQKAGQKCTAVRRILVPQDRVPAVTEDLVAELARTAVGDPADAAHRMGPLVNTAQLADVRAGIERLAAVCDVACGGADPIAETGCFVAPTLLVARDPEAAVIHSDEVFGPVATILPYSGAAGDAVALAVRGGGSLVTSVYSNDAAWTTEFVSGVGPWHGRVWIGSDKSAEQSLPPGMVLPSMVHGGPGRAGGGEELGGERGLELYMQRVALQGFKGLLDARFGRPNDA